MLVEFENYITQLASALILNSHDVCDIMKADLNISWWPVRYNVRTSRGIAHRGNLYVLWRKLIFWVTLQLNGSNVRCALSSQNMTAWCLSIIQQTIMKLRGQWTVTWPSCASFYYLHGANYATQALMTTYYSDKYWPAQMYMCLAPLFHSKALEIIA